jgi:hypothetical protein
MPHARCDVGGVQTQHSTWSYRVAAVHEHGAQIDLLIDRKDGVINLCEMKFSETAYEISKKYAGELRAKEEICRRVTGTRKTIFVTIVSPYGVKPNQQAQAVVKAVVTAEDLFAG